MRIWFIRDLLAWMGNQGFEDTDATLWIGLRTVTCRGCTESGEQASRGAILGGRPEASVMHCHASPCFLTHPPSDAAIARKPHRVSENVT